MTTKKNEIQRKLRGNWNNKKNYRDYQLYVISEDLEKAIELIEEANENIKELYNMTEVWEKNSTLDYDFNNWRQLNKIKGKILRYRNIIRQIINEVIEREAKYGKG